MEKKCKNCLLFDKEKNLCKVAILIEGKKFNLPVDLNDNCHMDELQIPVEQIRWFEEDKDNKKTIKIEYPENLFKQ
jgi:hypothetical protein